MDAAIEGSLFPARHWHALADGRIQCDVCPRFCRLHEGQRGLCFVRARQDDALVLTTYGRSSGFCIDPIEKKPLNHFLPGTPVFSFGTAGCNLTCKFCQNYDITKAREIDRLNQDATPAMIAEAARQLGCRSVAFTYNDPVIFLEYAIDTARACHEAGLEDGGGDRRLHHARGARASSMPTSTRRTSISRALPSRSTAICAAAGWPTCSTRWYGSSANTNVWLEVTTLLIPGENDGDAEIGALAAWFAAELGRDVPLHFTAFHPDWRMREHPPTPPATLTRARAIAMSHGLRYVYTGNVHDGAGGSTYCHACGALLIGRDWYELTGWGSGRGRTLPCVRHRGGRDVRGASRATGAAGGSRCNFDRDRLTAALAALSIQRAVFCQPCAERGPS